VNTIIDTLQSFDGDKQDFVSRKQLIKIFETLPFGMVIVDDSLFIKRVNAAFCSMLGYGEEELLARTLKDIMHPDNLAGGIEIIGRLQKGEIQDYKTEERYIRKDTTLVWGASTITVIRDEEDRFQYYLLMVIDITKRMSAMEALRRSEERYRLLVDHVNAGVFQTTVSGELLQANNEVVKVAGYDNIGDLRTVKLVNAYVNPDDRLKFIETLKRDGEVRNMEILMKKQSGEPVWVSMNAVLHKDDDGAMENILGIINDITDRKQVENELRSSMNILDMIFKTSPDAAIITRISDGLVIDVNNRFVEVSGYTRDEVIGKTSLELRLYDDPESRRKIVEKLKTSGNCENIETVFRPKSGRTIIGLMSAQVVHIYGDVHVYSIIHDITERKKTELLLQNAQKLESLGILAGGIAHDFNNLLSGVFGFIDLACGTSKDVKTSQYLHSALGAIERAKALTMQLLTFSKGGAPVKRIAALSPIVQEAAQFSLSGSNVHCSYKFADGLWFCNIDKHQISQVVGNMIINAQQAMPDGGNIEISAKNVSFEKNSHLQLQDGPYVKISIRDFGVGIPAEILPRIFDPFYTTKMKGHGLGLATCYSIVNRHGGCIEVESEPGKGSVFHVYLPASSEAAVEESRPAISHKGSGGTVVLVDDEEIVRNVFRKMLESLGYKAVCCVDGIDAVEQYQKGVKDSQNFVAMICDLTIPGGMGGVQLVKEIRKFNEKLPIFVASGYADDPVMRNPREYGFNASISKPFTIAELSELLGGV
jgi:two-component system cell cycle sensor histidine kinase/response regulator CckA